MSKYNPDSPWNPAVSVDITPKEYEKQVVIWLEAAQGELEEFTIKHLEIRSGPGGEYEFDAVARFTAFKGANFVVLVTFVASSNSGIDDVNPEQVFYLSMPSTVV